MNRIILSFVLLFLCLFSPFSGLGGLHAQLCEISIPDTALQKNVYFIRMAKGGEKADLKLLSFDAKGRTVYDEPCEQDFYTGRIFLANSEHSFFIQKGKTTRVTCKKEKGQVVIKFAGDNVVNNTACAAQRKGYPYPEYFLQHDSANLVADFDRKIAKLEKTHADLAKQIAKMTNPEMQAQVAKDNDFEHIRFTASMMRMKAQAAGTDYLDDPQYQALLDKIDVNDPYSDSYNLTGTFISGKARVPADATMSQRGAAQMRCIQQYVTNATIKRSLQAAVIQETLNEANDDVDSFMKELRGIADSTLYHAAEILAESLKKTQGGMKAPVCEFTDLDGKVWKSSDFEGKLLYIDFWATWCGPCKQEIPHMEKLVEEFKGDDRVALISISIDTDTKAWEDMVKRDKPQWPQFLAKGDQQAAISTAWGINAIPRFVLINPDGTIRLSNAFRPSDPKAAEKIREALGGK